MVMDDVVPIAGYGRHNIDNKDIDRVVEILRSNFLTQGAAIPRFERELAQKVGAKYAVAVTNATSALHLACLAVGVGPGDIVWTAPNTFVASSNCALYCGAKVDFVDIDETSGNISFSALEEKIQLAKRSGTLPKVIILVHFAGASVEMKPIYDIMAPLGVRIIEDASHALGGSYNGRPVGCCQYSDVAVFSFHPVKMITTGEGGAIVCNDDDINTKLTALRSHGITRQKELLSIKDPPSWYYEQKELGFNFRMTDLQAALGSSQLERLHRFVAKRRAIAERYRSGLNSSIASALMVADDVISSYHLFVIRVDPKVRDRLYAHLNNNKIGVGVHYIPVHLQPYYQNLGFKEGDFPKAEAYYASVISLPIFFDLDFKSVDRVIENVNAFSLVH